MTWINVNGEGGHSCDLPWSIDSAKMGATHLQKRHAGSIWQCSCKTQYEWSGKDWLKII